MRVFTKDEEELLRRINDGRGRNLYNLIDPWIDGVSFQVNTVTNNVVFIFQQNHGLNIINRLNEIQNIVIQSVNLIKLFEEKGYIFSFENTNNPLPIPFIFGQAAINLPSISYQFSDLRVSQLFSQYSTREIFVTPELNKFITDGFITREEVRANRQFNITKRALKITTTALIISIIAFLANLSFNLYDRFIGSEKTKKEIIILDKQNEKQNDTRN